ncbi:hypothetical protein HNQ71_006554 [Mesorhizobium sangaii]|uniref:Uncharacterized protein n=1 Tax=Mesorhizobium sangaii TaxID=505389 RepID=A0A841PYI3_9HYPH|nr:hypothetical protein [Mesorhizobium sangaii]
MHPVPDHIIAIALFQPPEPPDSRINDDNPLENILA